MYKKNYFEKNMYSHNNMDSYEKCADQIDIIDYIDELEIKTNIISFNTESFLHAILNSFFYDYDKIIHQLNIDLPRNRIYYNKKIINFFTDVDEISYDISWLKIYEKFSGIFSEYDEIYTTDIFRNVFGYLSNINQKIKGNNITLFSIFAALITQASFFFPYSFIFNNYFDENDPLYTLNSMDTGRGILFDVDNNGYMNIQINLQLSKKNTNNNIDETIYKIKIIMYTNIILDSFFKNENIDDAKKYDMDIFQKLGVMHWSTH